MSELRCLQLFVREPVAGKVKTRLEDRLGVEHTLALYRAMLGRQISLANQCAGVIRQLWVAGDIFHADFANFAGDRFMQPPGDIGERMSRALRSALDDHDMVILIGCDCPALDVSYIQQAFAILASGNDAVLGPATDGGYVLIGLRRWEPVLFRNIDWGKSEVLAQTRTRLAEAGFSWSELGILDDIDVPDDLDRLAVLVEREYKPLV